MDNFLNQPEKKIPAAIAWILCGVVIFSGVHALVSFMFTSVEFGLWYAKSPLSILIIWKSLTVIVNILVTIVTMLVIATRLKKSKNLPKTFAILMGIVWLILTVASQWMLYATIPIRSQSYIMEDFKTLMKVENTVYIVNSILYILTIFIGFLLFMNRKQEVQE